MNLLGLGILGFLCGIIFLCERRWALLGLMGAVLFLPQSQSVELFGVNLTAMRFAEVAAFFRVVSRGELAAFERSKVDRMFVGLYIYTTVIFLLRSNVDQAYVVGAAVDAFLAYFSFRSLITSLDDVYWFARWFLVLLAVYSGLLLMEVATGSTPFRFLGAEVAGWERGGRPRCVGSFRNPTLLGTLGSSFLPLYVGLWWSPHSHRASVIGVALCLLIVWAANSGGSWSCVGISVLGWLCWRERARMRRIRRFGLAALIVLGFAMKAPIWYILARVSSVSGGDGYHRARLLDMAFQNLDKWWLVGMPISETVDWFPYTLAATGAADITNYYISFGLTAGLVSMVCFVALLHEVFKGLGGAMTALRGRIDASIPVERLCWGAGVVLFVHTFNWLGVPYFDQTQIYWYCQLAILVVVSCQVREFASLSAQS